MLSVILLFLKLSLAYRLEVKGIPPGFTVEVDNSSLLSQAFIYRGSRFAASIRIINKSMYIESNAKVEKIGLVSGKVIGTYEHGPVDPRDWAAALIADSVKVFIQPATTETFNSRMIELLRAIPQEKRAFSTSIMTSYATNSTWANYGIRKNAREFVWRRIWDRYLMGRVCIVGNHIFMDGDADVEFYLRIGSQWSYYNGKYPLSASSVNAVALVFNPQKLDLDEITNHLLAPKNRPDIKTYVLRVSNADVPSNEGQLIDMLAELPRTNVDFSARQISASIENLASNQHQLHQSSNFFSWESAEKELFGRLMFIGNQILFERASDVELCYFEEGEWFIATPNDPLDSQYVTKVALVYNPNNVRFTGADLDSGDNKMIETVVLMLN